MQIKEILFPKICLGCGFLGCYVCLKCGKDLSYVKRDICLYCTKPSIFGFTHPICEKSKRVDGLISIFYYNNTLKKIIKNIKYRLVKEAFGDLFKSIDFEILGTKLSFFKKIKNNIFLCPIPLHPNRLKQRGFNQTEILANFFAEFLKIPVMCFLERIKDTRSQAKIEKDRDRYLNMKSAFRIKEGIALSGKSIILVDDLVTSGSTVKEAAFVLKKVGVDKVYVLALAKG